MKRSSSEPRKIKGGARETVEINAQGQHPNWAREDTAISQRKKLQEAPFVSERCSTDGA